MPGIQAADGGEVDMSGAARLADIARDATVRSSFPLLAHAAAADDARRPDASLGDSVAPATACKTTAGSVQCALSGTSVCVAKDPSTDLHAILDGGPCWRVFTSLTGVALHALDAVVEFGVAEQAASVQRVRLPAASAYGFQHLIHAPQEESPALAAICVAAVRRVDGDVRLVLGGVSPRPYRVYTSVEEEATAGGLDEDTIAGLAERALLDAETDPASMAKVVTAAALLRRAIEEIDANSR
jgi:CO/xanthine dehydrogenase FAD-binding subunit